MSARFVLLAVIAIAASFGAVARSEAAGVPSTLSQASSAPAAVTASIVEFDSADGHARLTGYLFRPPGDGPFPAIVLMHGRGGLYSTLPGSGVSIGSLSVRHRHWARFWASEGYVALLVDSFAPRGYPAGFGRGTYGDRPSQVSEQTVRPLDADGAAAFLQARQDVIADRIGLLGWSNGAMAALARITRLPAAGPFRAAVALYPGCAILERDRARPQIPLLLLIAGSDAEVSPERCARWASTLAAGTAGFAWQRFEGASHNFDGLALGSRAIAADRAAAAAAEAQARDFFAQHLAPPQPR